MSCAAKKLNAISRYEEKIFVSYMLLSDKEGILRNKDESLSNAHKFQAVRKLEKISRQGQKLQVQAPEFALPQVARNHEISQSLEERNL